MITYTFERLAAGNYALCSSELGQTGHSVQKRGREWVAENMDGDELAREDTKRECIAQLLEWVE